MVITKKAEALNTLQNVTNENSVSIELCDCNNVEKPYSNKQIKAVRKLIKYIQRYCPNANKIIRHFDVNGKHCPGTDNG